MLASSAKACFNRCSYPLEQQMDASTATVAERPAYFFNDDDVYVVDARTLKVVRHIGCKSCEYIGSELHGFRAYPGQMVLKGMQARAMGVRA